MVTLLKASSDFWSKNYEYLKFAQRNEPQTMNFFRNASLQRFIVILSFQIEAKVIIAKLVQCFDFKLVPGVKLLFIPEVTLKSKNRTPLYLTLRKR